jgi:hypothetical protein
MLKNLKIKIYETVISSEVFCGYETLSLTLKRCRLRMSEKKVLKRKLHTEKLHNLYFA